MKCVLIVSHGSREPATEAAFDAIVDMVRAKLPDQVVESACMQLSERTLDGAIESLASRGASSIQIVPYFLFTGVHIKQDIPEMINGYREKYPDIQLSLSNPLGVDERLADILIDRINE